jgi:hypothetical protein
LETNPYGEKLEAFFLVLSLSEYLIPWFLGPIKRLHAVGSRSENFQLELGTACIDEQSKIFSISNNSYLS